MNQSISTQGLSLDSLTLPKEKTYFIFVAIFSSLVWLIVLITIFGAIIALLISLMAWIAHGLLNAHLRSESVRVGKQQLPELYDAFHEVCAKLELDRVPRLYVLQAGGLLNAFALRFCGRNFVVIYSSMLEALGPSSPEMKFLLGHEIGHIRSNHIIKKILLAPGLGVPLLGPAYRRACESSCDRHGAYVSGDLGGALRALLLLGGGRGTDTARLDPAAFANQHYDDLGFFVSWHELVSGYPTLSARTSQLLALADPAYAKKAPRNPFAYLFALFGGGGGGHGLVDLFVIWIVVGLFASMAIPAFNKVREQSYLKARHINEQQIAAAYDAYYQANGAAPKHFSDFIGPGKYLEKMPVDPAGGTYTVVYDQTGHPTVEYVPPAGSQPPPDASAP